MARRGPLGWTCIGPTAKNGEFIVRSHSMRTLLTKETTASTDLPECCNLDRTLKSFWEIESAGTDVHPKILTQEEKAALEKVEKSLQLVDGRYQVGISWKEEQPKLPDNRPMATARLRSTEKNLMKNPVVAKEYQSTIKAYVEKGYLQKIDPAKEEPPGAWYLPHFPIARMDKSTTKVRIAFYCSAKYDGISLDDVIHAGPKLQQDLFDVLIRFCRNPVAVACDIKEMYL